MDITYIIALSIFIGWLADLCLGDPARLPHPIVLFGRWISFFERHTNKGTHRKAKGAFWSVISIVSVYLLTMLFLLYLNRVCAKWEHVGPYIYGLISAILIFYCLAGTTLIKEVRMVFAAADRSLSEGQQQVGRIVGRNTSELTEQEVRTAALETLSENLSDGVIAPLFWLWLFGIPGMLTYKMINTLDSMIGYHNERYKDFGCWAARIDDFANYIPARLTALLMAVASIFPHKGTTTKRTFRQELTFILQNGRRHASPNSGYPEAALAGILDCRFGGPHHYGNMYVYKPYIGTNNRKLTTDDMHCAIAVNRYAEIMMVIICLLFYLI